MNSQYNDFLIWPGGEIKLKRCLSNKRLGNLKIKNVKLSKHPIRTILNVSRNGGQITIDTEWHSEVSWCVRCSNKISIGKWEEAMYTFSRAVI